MILVVGGTGDLGGRIVRRLIEDGRQLRCVVRAGSDGSPLRARGAEVVTGDLTDPASLRMACEGVDIVVASATVIGGGLRGPRGPRSLMPTSWGWLRSSRPPRPQACSGSSMSPTPDLTARWARRWNGRRSQPSEGFVPRRCRDWSCGPMPSRRSTSGRWAGSTSKPARSLCSEGATGSDDGSRPTTSRRWWRRSPPSPTRPSSSSSEARTRSAATRHWLLLNGQQAGPSRCSFKVQRVPLPVARLAMKLRRRPNDALASIFGTGVMTDQSEITWDDAPLRERGVTPRSATDWINQQAGHS